MTFGQEVVAALREFREALDALVQQQKAANEQLADVLRSTTDALRFQGKELAEKLTDACTKHG